MSDNPKLSIIIVNWNAADVLKPCLNSVYGAIKSPFEVIVVDNNSSDGSVAMIKKEFPLVKLVEEKENLGFSKGNNIGFRYSSGNYIIVLNPDTVLLDGAVDKIASFLDSHPDVRIAGPMMYNSNLGISKDGRKDLPSLFSDFFELFLVKKTSDILSALLAKNTLLKAFLYSNYLKSGECRCISGSCMFFHRSDFESLGGFDESVPLYLDDIDICMRAYKKRWKIYYYSGAAIIHIGQHSTKKASGYKMYDLLRLKARVFYYRKYHRPWKVFFYRAMVFLSVPYLLALDAAAMPYYAFLGRLAEWIWVIKKHLSYLKIVFLKDPGISLRAAG